MGDSVMLFPDAAFAARYAPVHQIRILSMSGNRLRGLAAPEAGPRPSAVILTAGERVLGVSIASAFSEEAKVAGLRDGWCGFEVAGLQHALALGPRGEVRCAATNHSLITLDDDAIASAASAPHTDITVEALRSQALRENGTANEAAVWPFAEAFFQEKGFGAFIDALYAYLLGRPCDKDGRSHYEQSMAAGAAPQDIWLSLLESEEFKNRGLKIIPGPFDPGFPFGLAAMINKKSQSAVDPSAGSKPAVTA
jgi:hypothetical protein